VTLEAADVHNFLISVIIEKEITAYISIVLIQIHFCIVLL